MRFIDDKGKIFGLINIFDLLFIILIFAVIIPGAAFQYRHFKDQKVEEEQKYRHIYKYVKAKAYLMPEVADRIKKGDRLLDEDGNVLLEVDNMIANKPVFLGAVAEKSDVGSRLSGVEKKSYSLNVPQSDGAIFLGESFDVIKDGIELSSIRRVEISLKIWCIVERDGAFIIIKGKLPLLIGRNITLVTKEYIASFTITHII